MYSSLERTLFNCPVINKYTECEIYPSLSAESVLLMSLKSDSNSEYRQVFGFLRTNTYGEKYIEIDFYNEQIYSNSYRRFIIQRGYMLSENDETVFLNHCKNANIVIDIEDFVILQEAFAEYCPDIPVRVYDTYEIGEYLKRIYFSTHSCGAREILYKAGLEHIASYINEIDGYNLIGSSPERILSMPLNLIRILDKNDLDEYVKNEDLRKIACVTYEKFSTYCGKNNNPNRYQWLYLVEYRTIGGVNHYIFNKKIYRRLGTCKSNYEYSCYKRYMELALQLGQYNPYKKLPKAEDIISVTSKMETLVRLLNEKDEKDAGIVRFNNRGYKYEDKEFFVMTPLSVLEIFDESCQQDNCLSGYVDDLAVGKTNIVFIRRKNTPEKSYITMEIHGRHIVQAKARYNDLPSRKDFEFIEKFAKHNWLEYDPEYLIFDDDYDFGSIEDELHEYLEDFRERNSWPRFPDDGVIGTQLYLWDCFPECFSTEFIDEYNENEKQRELREEGIIWDISDYF